MTDTFDRVLTIVFGEEGGYVNDPKDRGGETKFGISKRSFPDLNIATLTKAQARAIYQTSYWGPLRCADMAFPAALAVFDTGVNCGVPTAARLLQRAVGVVEDGKIGPQTLAAVKRRVPSEVALNVLAYRIVRNPDLATWDAHGLGWSRRCLRVYAEALAG